MTGLDLPALGSIVAVLEGIVALLETRWLEALEKLGGSERTLAELGSWPGHHTIQMNATVMRLNVLFWLGRAGDTVRQIPTELHSADERGHLTGWLWLRMMQGWALGCCGRLAEAMEALADARARTPDRGFELVRWYIDHMRVQHLVAQDNGEAAWEALVAARRQTRFLFTSEPQRMFGQWVTVAAALARPKPHFAEARRACARLRKEAAPCARSLSIALEAAIASVADDPERALQLLDEAEPRLREEHLELAGAAVASARAKLRGDDTLPAWAVAQSVSPKALWALLPGRWRS
jgi:hypothetical protein